VSRLEDADSDVRRAAFDAFGNQTTLPETILRVWLIGW
jgi:hypothetical protein